MSDSSLSFVSAVCPVCSSDQYEVIGIVKTHHREIDDDFQAVSCDRCRCSYLNPRLDDKSLDYCYGRYTQPSGSTPTPPPAGATFLQKLWRKVDTYGVAESIHSGPVLDLGCNDGGLMKELLARGIAVDGIEFNEAVVERCQAEGLNVQMGDIRNLQIPPNRYRTIVLSHVLEHLADPVSLLRGLAEALRPDGQIVVCVPNCQSPVRSLFGGLWHGWDPPFHLVHYSPRTLRQVFNLAGLKVSWLKGKVLPDDLRRSYLLWRGQQGRLLWMRLLSAPVAIGLTMLGFKSYLLAGGFREQTPSSTDAK